MLTRYSHSALNSFKTCPRQFKFAYIEKPQVPDRVIAETYLGNAVHRTLKTVYDRAADGVTVELDAMLSLFRAEWEKPERLGIHIVKEHMAVDDYIRLGEKMLTDYHEQYYPYSDGLLLGTEVNLQFDVPDSPIHLTTRIDRMWKRDDGVIEICDYKTGKSIPKGGTDREFFDQMGLYCLAVKKNHPDFGDIELIQYLLRFKETVRHRPTDDELDELIERIKQDASAIRNAERLDDFAPRESPLCDYCKYYDLCPAKRHQLILARETGESADTERTTAQTASELAEKYIEIDTQIKQLKAEKDALREDITRTSQQLSLTKLTAPAGDLSIRISRSEKFVTKTDDPNANADLNALARRLQFDEFFSLDTRSLMREVYAKDRLTEEQREQLKDFVVEQIDTRISIRRAKDTDLE